MRPVECVVGILSGFSALLQRRKKHSRPGRKKREGGRTLYANITIIIPAATKALFQEGWPGSGLDVGAGNLLFFRGEDVFDNIFLEFAIQRSGFSCCIVSYCVRHILRRSQIDMREKPILTSAVTD